MSAVSAANYLYMWPEQRDEYMLAQAELERREAEEAATREAKRRAARERRKAREEARKGDAPA